MTVRNAALAVAIAIRDDDPRARALAVALADAVLDQVGARLAHDVIEGGPLWAVNALRLVELALGDDADVPDAAGGAS